MTPREDTGRRLARLLRSRRGYDCLNPEGYGWCDGGCGILATAIHRWVGTGSLTSLLGSYLGGSGREAVQHILLRIGDLYIDGDGISTEGELVSRWHDKELVAVTGLIPFDLQDATNAGIPFEQDKIERTFRFLNSLPLTPARVITACQHP